jgi:DNA polymerase (family 10)
MTNNQIAKVFEDIAEMLKLKKDNIFKIRAYQKVAHSIGELVVELEQLVKEDRLKEIPGVGEAIAKKLTELVTTGKLEYYEKLKAEFSERTSAIKGGGGANK